jgi:c-di-GMP-binding flagellar brake protein YcgR
MDGVECRLRSSLVGIKPKKYLILDTPHLMGIETKIYAGNKIAIIFLSQGVIYGFKTTILNSIRDPSRLMFITYPEVIECHELRDHQRVQCYMPAIVKFDGDMSQCEGVILDISCGGCRFSTRTVSREKSHLFQNEARVNIAFKPLGTGASMICDGKIMNIKIEGDKTVIGVAFVNVSNRTRSELEAYVKSVIEYTI